MKSEDTIPKLTKGMFTSRTEEWETPKCVFDALNKEFDFCLDVCATAENTKVPHRFITKEENALEIEWTGRVSRPIFWMNPPYGREIGKWMEKAYRESLRGATVVCLVHARTDTAWWHNYAMLADEIRLVRGRLKFGKGKNGAPFPSCVIIFRDVLQVDRKQRGPIFSSVSYR